MRERHELMISNLRGLVRFFTHLSSASLGGGMQFHSTVFRLPHLKEIQERSARPKPNPPNSNIKSLPLIYDLPGFQYPLLSEGQDLMSPNIGA